MFHWAYSDPSQLLVYGREGLHSVLESSEGVRQGDPFSACFFALGVQPLYEEAIRDRPECHAVSVQDDLSLIGPQAQVFAAFDLIQRRAAEFQLTLRVDKCAVCIPVSVCSPNTRESIVSACADRQLSHADSLETLGVMLGDNDTVRAHAEAAVDSQEQLFTAPASRPRPQHERALC